LAAYQSILIRLIEIQMKAAAILSSDLEQDCDSSRCGREIGRYGTGRVQKCY